MSKKIREIRFFFRGELKKLGKLGFLLTKIGMYDVIRTGEILGQLFRTGKIYCINTDFNDIKFNAKCYNITAISKRIVNTQF